MRPKAASVVMVTTSLLLGPLVVAAYWPGLHGGFLFDDYGNLTVLGHYGSVDNWPAFWRYITAGKADPTGRPLTLLTFLLDGHDWPTQPLPFKRTNLILHLCNGLLLFFLLSKLGQLLNVPAQRARTAALLGCALWLLHPLLVSTTLYVVQREAMLPATCVMAGLLLWLHGRELLLAGRLRAGTFWICAGLAGCTALGILAKANGALLPIYTLLIELIVLAPWRPLADGAPRRLYRTAAFFLVLVPASLLISYLLWVGVHGVMMGGTPGTRSWTYAQRLLTEPRVLIDYLTLLWLPRPLSSGLFNDSYVVSTSWLHPAGTLSALLAVAALLVSAWVLRRRHPAWALAVLFYFAGQLLESSSIALELYFEHRNYVPALLMFWPISLWLADDLNLCVLKRGLMIVLPLGLAWMTHERAEIWGDPTTQALIWAQANPDSPRAQASAADVEMQAGHPEQAVRRLERLLARQPEQAQLVFNLIDARCMMDGIGGEDIAAARQAMRSTANTGSLFVQWAGRSLPIVISGHCPGLTPSLLVDLVEAGLHNPKLAQAGPRQDLIYMRGSIALAQHQPTQALANFIHALDLQVRPGIALEAAASLGAAGYPSQALQLLDHYQQVQGQAMAPNFGMPMLHAWVLAHQHYWPHELAHLRHQLSLDAEAAKPNTAASTNDPSTLR
jgi:tetratricopeptide (TPR) repeat protein